MPGQGRIGPVPSSLSSLYKLARSSVRSRAVVTTPLNAAAASAAGHATGESAGGNHSADFHPHASYGPHPPLPALSAASSRDTGIPGNLAERHRARPHPRRRAGCRIRMPGLRYRAGSPCGTPLLPSRHEKFARFPPSPHPGRSRVALCNLLLRRHAFAGGCRGHHSPAARRGRIG
ncbi:MAG: hypothetical protein JWP03_4813 [Phycisphaerales bacterium]|nr:hypothetical protein [Phycisphaerales bacterium]